MSQRIQGITIELGADTTGIEKALKNVNTAIGQTQRELNKVDKALKLDPSNMALIEQKSRLLGNAVSQATQKLEALKAAQAKVADGMATGQNTQSQYDALTREISNTKIKLEQLTKEQQNFASTAGSMGGALAGISGALGSFADKAQSVATATRGISLAATAALGGMVALTASASSQADEWNTLSQQTGLATDSIQKFQFASGLIDVDMSSLVSSIRTMKGHLDDSSGIWEKIGVQTKMANGQYRDIESIFWDTVKAISQIGNETERDSAAMAIFGKRADELAGILDDGGAKMKALGNAAEDMGVIVSPESLESLNMLNDRMELLKSQFKGAFMQAAANAAQALAPAFEMVANAASGLAQKIAKLNPVTFAIVAVILLLISAISPAAALIANVTRAIQGLIAVLPLLSAGLMQVQAAATAALGNPVVLAVVAIIAAVVALGVAVYEVVKHWDEIKSAASTAAGAVQSAFSSVQSAAASAGAAISSGIGKAVEGIKDIFKGIGSSIISEFQEIPNTLSSIKSAFSTFVNAVKKVGNQISNIFSNMVDTAREAGERLITGFADGVRKAINKVIEVVQNMIDRIKQLWSRAEQDAGNAGQKAGDNFAKNYNSGSSRLQQPRTFSSFSSFIPGNWFNNPSNNPTPNSYSGELLSAVNTLNSNIVKMNASSSDINVELVGSAKDIFSTVRVQNSQLKTATGYHALA